MRTSHFKAFALAGVMALLFVSCSRNTVALDYTNAKGEVPQLGNLVFRFNKSLYPDSLVNNWDSSEYISFEPRIRGRFRWNAPDELVFSPEQPLQPATEYKAHVGKEALRFSKYNDIKEGDDIKFHTAPLQLSDAQVTWVLQDESRHLAVPQFSLHFNYLVAAEDIRDKLKLTVEGADASYTVPTEGYSNVILVRLNSFKAEDRNYEARLRLGKGLKPQKGDGTNEEITGTFSIPSPYVLNINNVESEHDGTTGTIHISTSQQIAGQNVNQFIHFSPEVNYTVDLDEDGLTLRSDKFNAEESYSFTIAPGLKGKVGGVLKEEYNGSVAFAELESEIAFTNNKAIYLSKKGAGNIEVRITNTPKVKIIVSKIYENNLLTADRYGYTPEDKDDSGESYSEDEVSEDVGGYSNSISGDVIYTKEIDTRSLPKSGNGRILNLAQIEDRLPEARGIYHVMIRSAKDYWVRDSRFISFSDIGLVAKQGEGKMFVFANSIKTATPLQGVVVNIYGANNQLIGTGNTNNDGAAEVTLTTREFRGFKPAMVIAKTNDDFTYLPFNNTRVSLSRFEVGGKHTNHTGLDAFVYAERDIYRPGERLNFSVVLRDRNWRSPGGIPIKLKLLMPNGKELKSLRKTLNEQGATDGSVDIADAAITGSYTLEVYSSNDVLLATKNFMIEEFVPDRIKVSATLDKTALHPSDKVTLAINAVNFFGPPAANRKVETEVQVEKKAFSSKKFPNYDFNLDNEHTFFDKDVREGQTDAAGNSSIVYDVPELYNNRGLLQASFYTTVFDETGRPVSRITRADIFTQDVFNGIGQDGYGYYPLNQAARFDLATVDRNGNPVESRAVVSVIKHEYRTVLARSGSYFRYESQKQDKILVAEEIGVHGSGAFFFTPRTPGEYELRMYRPGNDGSGAAYVSKSFYSYGSWGGDNSSFEVNTEGHVDIDLDKENYATGESARILFKTPFSGRMLVTIETDHVLSYQYIDVAKKTASMDLKLTGDHVPNIYVSATLIKPHEVSDIPLTVAHGFKSIKVDDRSRHLAVNISAQASVRSHTHQTVRVQAAPGAYVSLAAVDNGVLQVSNFQTPDPYDYYYQKKALEVASYDMYPLLFPELRARLSSTGGDGDLSLDKRVNPMKAKRFKIMSYWSGLKKANGSGVAEFEFDVPQFSGQIRLMAVAFKDDKFGSAESTTTVADPLVLSSALPRFMSPGDTVLVPVTISNTTSKNASGQATLQASGPVKVVGAAAQNVAIGPNSEGRVTFKVIADPNIGIGHVSVEVRALGEKFTDETEISVRPPSTLQKSSGSGSIAGGSTQQITIPQNDMIPSSFRYQLVVSRSSVAEIAEQLRYVVQYPFGCTEQTVSSAFPQLYYGDFSDALGLKSSSGQAANANVLEAMRKIKMRQLYSGGVTLWDGEMTENWWTTVYAAHFLLEARKAGFDVDNSLLETMLSYLANRLKNKLTIDYYFNRNQHKKIAPKEVAYSLYVLSLAGRSQVAAMNYYKANPQLLALDERYLLSAAYAVSGDRRSYLSLLPASFSGEESVQQTGGSFYSALRDEAISLSTLVDVDPGNAQIPVMRRHVIDRIKSDRYLNTQEQAFSFLALGKIARAEKGSNVTAEVRANGKTIANVNGDWKGTSDAIRSNTVQLVTKGTGHLYYSWVAEGISATGSYKEEDNYIRVSRRFFDRYGHAITGTTFHQNDLVIVQLTLERAYDSPIENIVLTDLLPAGFEIENPRTKELPGMDWIKDGEEPTALDVRDDRIHFFVDAHSTRQRYYYAVRAVSLGLFKQGPVSADAMYNGEIHSYHGAQTVRVE